LKRRFNELFDKNKFKFNLKIILLFLFLVLAANVIGVAYSRYESNANIYSEANVAYFIVDQGTQSRTITLDGLEPSNDPYIFTINVYNYDDNKRCDVNLHYNVSMKATTNLPLQFQVIRNETYSASSTNIIDTSNVISDDDGMYYNELIDNDDYEFTIDSNQMDQYSIIVNFPLTYKTDAQKYQGLIDLVTFTIHAEQDLEN